MLIIRNLTKTYKNGRGIEAVNLNVAKGEIYGLLGPNGAGKTTLLKVAAGLLSKDDGQCYADEVINGEDTIAYKLKTAGMIGETVLYDYMSSMDHLAMMALHREGITEEEMETVLAKMNLLDYRNEPVRQFSTGMKQRLAFAMCLLTEPEILLLDEPFNGLDIEGKILIRESLLKLREEKNTAIIISSHLIHDLEEMATTVGIIKGGHMIAEEKVCELLRHHRNLEDYFVHETVGVKEGA